MNQSYRNSVLKKLFSFFIRVNCILHSCNIRLVHPPPHFHSIPTFSIDSVPPKQVNKIGVRPFRERQRTRIFLSAVILCTQKEEKHFKVEKSRDHCQQLGFGVGGGGGSSHFECYPVSAHCESASTFSTEV